MLYLLMAGPLTIWINPQGTLLEDAANLQYLHLMTGGKHAYLAAAAGMQTRQSYSTL